MRGETVVESPRPMSPLATLRFCGATNLPTSNEARHGRPFHARPAPFDERVRCDFGLILLCRGHRWLRGRAAGPTLITDRWEG